MPVKKTAVKKKPRRVTFPNPKSVRVRDEYIILHATTPEGLAAHVNTLRADAHERMKANRSLFVDVEAYTPPFFDGQEYLQKVEIYERVHEVRGKRNHLINPRPKKVSK